VLTFASASLRGSSPSLHPHGDIDENVFYKVRTILAERVVRKRIEYQIDWEDNERTGEKYSPTWEPKENITEDTLADWEASKLARKAGMSNLDVSCLVEEHSYLGSIPCEGYINFGTTTDARQPNYQV
jgi:hypothetical protein